MEIPIIGKFFKRSSGENTEVPRPVQMERYRPRVRKELVRETLMRRAGERDSIRKAREILREPTEEVLRELADARGRITDKSKKFVRNGDRIVIGDYIVPHIYYALAAGMQDVDDAGFVEQRTQGERSLFVSGGSEGLHIEEGNVNRPATIELLRRLVPSFAFEEKPKGAVPSNL